MTIKEKPILFSGEMVRAILDGTKTQTRRLVKEPEYFGCFTGDCPHEKQSDCNVAIAQWCKEHSPYGGAGDELWGKETFSPWADEFTKKACHSKDLAVYRADYDDGTPPLGVGGCEHWKPSIFMPRALSRITLEITAVRVERLQDISDADAIAEGVSVKLSAGIASSACGGKPTPAQFEYYALWESINGKGSWAKNPWVWVIEFKRKEQ